MGGEEDYFGPGIISFAHLSMAFYFLRGTVLDFFSQDYAYKNKQKSLFYMG